MKSKISNNTANICSERIKIAREKLGYGQIDLAVALETDFQIKIDQSDISEIERGVRGIKDFELNAIARVLSVSPTWLLRGEND